jgi:hypothetical protein
MFGKPVIHLLFSNYSAGKNARRLRLPCLTLEQWMMTTPLHSKSEKVSLDAKVQKVKSP